MSQTSKAFPYSSYIPFYVNGLRISNDAVTPNSLLDVAVGSTLDSTGTFQIALNTAAVINSANNGLNGLDTGTIAASSLYAVYLVADPVLQQVSGCMLSLSLTGPLLPFGYSAYALIGYVATDSSAHFLKGYWTGGESAPRLFMYDAPQATAVTAGNATSYTAVSLAALVPAVQGLPVYIESSYVPATAGNALSLQPASGTGAPAVVTGQVATVHVTTQSFLTQSVVSSVPEINYKVGNASDAVAINVLGYWFAL